jgi:SHS2 domain-containing protein
MREADSYLSSEIIRHLKQIKRNSTVPTADYVFLPHITDAYVQASGTSLENALASAGKALFDTLCDLNSITPKLTERVVVEGHDEIALVYNWLESLLLKFELEQKVYSEFKVDKIARSSQGLRTTAEISGEPFDRQKHGPKVEVKAVTYHKMEVVQEPETTTLRFILDL